MERGESRVISDTWVDLDLSPGPVSPYLRLRNTLLAAQYTTPQQLPSSAKVLTVPD